MEWGLGFRAYRVLKMWSLRFRVLGQFEIQGLGFGFGGLGFRMYGLGFWGLGLKINWVWLRPASVCTNQNALKP